VKRWKCCFVVLFDIQVIIMLTISSCGWRNSTNTKANIYMLFSSSVLYALCSMLYALCSMLYALCSMLYALCSMLYAPCSMLYALCSMLYDLCSMIYALCSTLYVSLFSFITISTLTLFILLSFRYFDDRSADAS
jgi:hypothetical protein